MPNGPWYDPHGETEGFTLDRPLTDDEREMLRGFFARNPHPPWMTDTSGRYFPSEER